MIERIEVSAIKYPWGEVVTGFRHKDVINHMMSRRIKTTDECIQGFVGTSGAFYDREAAASVSKLSGQVPDSHFDHLFSEDLWETPPDLKFSDRR